jgi:hypothetical protein
MPMKPKDLPAGVLQECADALVDAGFRYDAFDEGLFVNDSLRKVISVRWLNDRPLEDLRAAIASRQGDVEFYFGRMAEDLARTLKRRYGW